MKKILLIKGGNSSEAAVSRSSAIGVHKALNELGFEVVDFEFESGSFMDFVRNTRPDLVFNAMHGEWGEDGRVALILDLLGVPYTHSGYQASAMSMNKFYIENLVKTFCLVKTASSFLASKENLLEMVFNQDCFIKPNDSGSSVDTFSVSKNTKISNEQRAIIKNSAYEVFLVCEYIRGVEISVAVLDNRAVGAVEIEPLTGFYDYTNKYTKGKTQYFIPPRVDGSSVEKAMLVAEKIHNFLGCNYISRSDFIITPANEVYFLEINTHPGFTETSLVPKIAQEAKGMSYKDLVLGLIKSAKFNT